MTLFLKISGKKRHSDLKSISNTSKGGKQSQETSLLLLPANLAVNTFADGGHFIYLLCYAFCILLFPLTLQVSLNQDYILQAVQYSAKMVA
jgi:hypothetical protein